jgi:hypothetical protein
MDLNCNCAADTTFKCRGRGRAVVKMTRSSVWWERRRKEVGDGRKKIRRMIEEEEDDECRIARENKCN